ncbi:MAG TPA: DUF192 domain-containing protein [archaeon]|nr:DUF192 domain-containing protein [archaeon]
MNLPEILALGALPLLLIPLLAPRNPELRRVEVRLANQTFSLEVADTVLTRMRGLQNRPSLGPDEGMLFVFNSSGRPTFWMKDVRIPLDIIFLDENFTVTEIFQNLPPCSGFCLFCKTYRPTVPFRYAIEVPAGTVAGLKLKAGQVVKIS